VKTFVDTEKALIDTVITHRTKAKATGKAHGRKRPAHSAKIEMSHAHA